MTHDAYTGATLRTSAANDYRACTSSVHLADPKSWWNFAALLSYAEMVSDRGANEAQ
jgi:hypothetical protein